MKGFKSGYGDKVLPFWAVFNLYVIFVITSTPGLAITPIMGTLQTIFPGTTQLETQFLELGPNIAAIPFVFIGGAIGAKYNNVKLCNWTCLIYGICGTLFFFVPNMICLIILSFLLGIFGGILSPLASAFIADMFNGKQRSAQYGGTSAVLNLVLMVSVIGTGYLAKIDWRLPFIIYLLPFIPLFFAKRFGQFIKEPTHASKVAGGQPKPKYKFSQNVDVKALVRYCIYYFIITLVIASISLYIPFIFSDASVAGDLTSILFLGIMASGFTLNWCLKFLKKNVALIVLIIILIGFVMMILPVTGIGRYVIVGLGIFLASYFYGIAQPYYYNRLSTLSTRAALTITLAIFAIMDSSGNVLAPFIIDGVADAFGTSANAHPLFAFKFCCVLIAISTVVVLIRQIIVRNRHSSTDEVPLLVRQEQAAAQTSAETKASAQTATVPASKVNAAPDNGARAADKATQTAASIKNKISGSQDPKTSD